MIENYDTVVYILTWLWKVGPLQISPQQEIAFPESFSYHTREVEHSTWRFKVGICQPQQAKNEPEYGHDKWDKLTCSCF